MSAVERLENAQAALVARGVKDVKFCFGATHDKPLTQVVSDVADVLEAVLAGNFSRLPAENDSVRI